MPRITQPSFKVSATPTRSQSVTHALELLLVGLPLGYINISASASFALWQIRFNVFLNISHHKRMLGDRMNYSISEFDFLAL